MPTHMVTNFAVLFRIVYIELGNPSLPLVYEHERKIPDLGYQIDIK